MKFHSHIGQSPRLFDAARYFRNAHDSIGQVRKYSGDLYWTHTERVELALWENGVRDEDILIAALGHDTLEDVYVKNKAYSLIAIHNKFGSRAAKMIFGLTDVYTKAAFPDYNRIERHAQETVRLVLESDEVKLVKASDIADNTADIAVQDPKYSKVYVAEKRTVIDTIFPVATKEYQIVIDKLLVKVPE